MRAPYAAFSTTFLPEGKPACYQRFRNENGVPGELVNTRFVDPGQKIRPTSIGISERYRNRLCAVRSIGILAGPQLRKKILDGLFRIHDYLPDAVDGLLELVEIQIAVLGADGRFPIPLVHVDAEVLVQKVVLAHRPHVRAEASPGAMSNRFSDMRFHFVAACPI